MARVSLRWLSNLVGFRPLRQGWDLPIWSHCKLLSPGFARTSVSPALDRNLAHNVSAHASGYRGGARLAAFVSLKVGMREIQLWQRLEPRLVQTMRRATGYSSSIPYGDGLGPPLFRCAGSDRSADRGEATLHRKGQALACAARDAEREYPRLRRCPGGHGRPPRRRWQLYPAFRPAYLLLRARNLAREGGLGLAATRSRVRRRRLLLDGVSRLQVMVEYVIPENGLLQGPQGHRKIPRRGDWQQLSSRSRSSNPTVGEIRRREGSLEP